MIPLTGVELKSLREKPRNRINRGTGGHTYVSRGGLWHHSKDLTARDVMLARYFSYCSIDYLPVGQI